MQNLRDLIYKLLDEVDNDLKITMKRKDSKGYEMWQLLQDPTGTILSWQELRDRKICKHQ